MYKTTKVFQCPAETECAQIVAGQAHPVALKLSALNSAGWFDHVASWSNPADSGSRIGCGAALDRSLAVPAFKVTLPKLPLGFPFVKSMNEKSLVMDG